MNKSVYSLVLMDDVVAAIDQMAYRQNTSRSNLINQILAEHVSLSTPEKRMRDIFSSLEQFMDETFQIQTQPSDAMLSIRSPLRYKYKPTIRYQVELYRNPGPALGKVKVSFRTQNAALIRAIDDFFRFWIILEQHYLKDIYPDGIRYELEPGRFTRELQMPPDVMQMTSEDLGNRIAAYVQMLDDLIKIYFAALDHSSDTAALLEAKYRSYQKKSPVIL